jgi:hypothetical protein
MFDKFKEVEEHAEIEFAAQGFILKVKGRDHVDNWMSKSFVFEDRLEFLDAIVELERRVEW